MSSPPFPPPPTASRPTQQMTLSPKVNHCPLHPEQGYRGWAQNPLRALLSSGEAKFSLQEVPGALINMCMLPQGKLHLYGAGRGGEGGPGHRAEAQAAATVMSCRTLARAPSPPHLLLPRGTDIPVPQPSLLCALGMACAPAPTCPLHAEQPGQDDRLLQVKVRARDTAPSRWH